MSVQTIIDTLEKLEKVHRSLLELALRKTEVIKKGDMVELDQILKNEQSHVAAIETIEKQRQVLVTDYLKSKGIDFSDIPTVADLIEAAHTENERELLQQVRERLVQVVGELKSQNDLNQKLVYQSLQFVNMSLEMIRPQNEQINYSGNQVKGQNSAPKRSIFDSQA
ncbi:flagellar protein FlgN [Ureibacillus acetophenoni]|uniref:FlgN protein n=1 Tax=Ureibacillus acetophenoni TaxID=614649 RepID=A0A285TZR9_9BACL|nr:flagellar protein FlgN [Ureibacillus acetophenoni]SOC34957.1 FlgN protein [Ureibacillus acetophenoni]